MLQYSRWTLAVAFAIVAVAAGIGFSQSDSPDDLGVSPHGPIESLTKPWADIEVAFQVDGLVEKKLVELGSVVKKGQVLMQLNEELIELRVEKLKMIKESDVGIKAAKAEWDTRENDLRFVQKLRDDNAASDRELREANLNVEIGELRHKQAHLEFGGAGIDYKLEIVRQGFFTLKAPIDGVVEKLYVEEGSPDREVSVGESVRALQSVIRLVQISTLRVDANVPLHDALDLKLGDKVWIRSRMPGRDKPVEGSIIHISKLSDPGSITKLVRIKVPNDKEYLEASWHVTVHLTRPTAAAWPQDVDSPANATTVQERS